MQMDEGFFMLLVIACPCACLSFTVRWARLGCSVLNTTSPQCFPNASETPHCIQLPRAAFKAALRAECAAIGLP